MRTEIKCVCCGNAISGQLCGYCGFMNIAALDEEAADEIKKEADVYRREVIDKLSDFSVVSYEYGWIEKDSKFDLISTKNVKIADGNDCVNGVFWSKDQFGQNLEGNNTSQQIEISYKYDGKKKKFNCSLIPVQCDDFWHLGLEITKELKLMVYLGNSGKSAKSEPIELDFD